MTHVRAVGERAEDDVAVAGHPADVGRAEIDVFFLQVEDVLRAGRPNQVAAGGVGHALGLTGDTRGVQDVQRMLGVQMLGLDDLGA